MTANPWQAIIIDAACAAPGSGDFDGGDLSTTDIPFMVNALLDPAPTEEMICTGDMNDDGLIDGQDVRPFVDAVLAVE